MTAPSAYPLTWPDILPRATRREAGQFKTTLSAALDNVAKSLSAFGRDSNMPVSGIVISSNVTLGPARPADSGIAVWFTWEGAQHCIAVDRYQTPAANLQAIHHVLEALRTELRHGTLALVRASFRGLQALPAPPAWYEVLGVKMTATPDEITGAYRKLARDAHPDKPGGSAAKMAELNRARDEGLRT